MERQNETALLRLEVTTGTTPSSTGVRAFSVAPCAGHVYVE
ncbi:hypothetical protein GFS60_01291 [Rhodococcus sp. WAY2]|nr:hypothetical protein GFS60_01291 [Rhodococcus sp. WAY2]